MLIHSSLKKKCDIKNEVYFDPKTKTWKMKTSYKGNLMVRRESSLFAKNTYQPITITAIGLKNYWGEKDALKVREVRHCENILWDGDIPEILVEERIPSSKIYTEKEIVVKRSKTLKNGKIKEWEEVEVHLIEKPMEKVNVKKVTLTEVDAEIKRSESTVELLKYVETILIRSKYLYPNQCVRIITIHKNSKVARKLADAWQCYPDRPQLMRWQRLLKQEESQMNTKRRVNQSVVFGKCEEERGAQSKWANVFDGG